MEKGRPIEPGCLALVLRSDRLPELINKVVTVERRAYGDVWVVDRYWPPGSPIAGEQAQYDERYLLRIDDPETRKKLEQEESEKTVWKDNVYVRV